MVVMIIIKSSTCLSLQQRKKKKKKVWLGVCIGCNFLRADFSLRCHHTARERYSSKIPSDIHLCLQSSSKNKRPFLHSIQHHHRSVAKAPAFDSCTLALTTVPEISCLCPSTTPQPSPVLSPWCRGTPKPWWAPSKA